MLGQVKLVRRRVKGWLKRVRGGYARRFRRFEVADLVPLLDRLGVREGAIVLCHSAYDRFGGFEGGPGDVIRVLTGAVGESGTLLMPTLPFLGSALDYAARQPLTDLVRTPSAMGIVTEIFRRMPGVVRSPHPTHPVAALGPLAGELTRDHHLAETPCGRHSPYLKLLDTDGMIVFLGVGLEAMTFYHGVEELLEPRMPVSPFTSEWYELQTRDAEGLVRTTRTRLYNRELSRRRDTSRLLPELRRARAWRTERVGDLWAASVPARAALVAVEAMADSGKFCYRRYPSKSAKNL